jgi:hypothetical protein
MKQIFLLLLGIYMPFLSLFAQCDEIVVQIQSPDDEYLIDRVIRSSDQHFILVGQKNTSALILKMDDCGNILWERTHDFGSEQAYRDVLEANGKFIAAGYCETCRMGDNARKVLVQELTLDGNLSGSTKTLGPLNMDANAYRIRSLSGNRFGVVGSRVITQGQASGNAMFLNTLDQNLSSLDFVFFPLLKSEEVAYDIVEVPGSGFMIVGGNYDIAGNASLRIVMTNNSLVPTWNRGYHDTPTDKEQAFRSVARLSNGDIILSGSRVTAGDNQQMVAAKVNPANGNLIQEATFGGNGDDFARDLFVVDQNRYLLSGMRTENFNTTPWAITINQNLEQTGGYALPQTGFLNSGISFVQNSKTHFAVAGTLLNFPFRGVFARTIDLTTSTDSPIAEATLLEVFPNPAKSTVQFRGIEIPDNTQANLFNLQGQSVLNTNVLGNRLELPTLPAGTYMISMIVNDQIISRPINIID